MEAIFVSTPPFLYLSAYIISNDPLYYLVSYGILVLTFGLGDLFLCPNNNIKALSHKNRL
jgi:hypothetical protein